MGYAVFLLVLTIPALEWLLAPRALNSFSRPIRVSILTLLLTATVAQAIDFQITFWREGPKREFEFDVPYKVLYDLAVAQPQRPIYLENGMWGPAYMDAYWYATVEGRPLSEFVRLPERAKPPSGAIVLSSNSDCQNCKPIRKSGVYLLYTAR